MCAWLLHNVAEGPGTAEVNRLTVMRTRIAVAVFAGVALLAAAGCTGDADEQPIDVAEDRLSGAISDGTLVAGFTISTCSPTLSRQNLTP